jgi:hypothetical protein
LNDSASVRVAHQELLLASVHALDACPGLLLRRPLPPAQPQSDQEQPSASGLHRPIPCRQALIKPDPMLQRESLQPDRRHPPLTRYLPVPRVPPKPRHLHPHPKLPNVQLGQLLQHLPLHHPPALLHGVAAQLPATPHSLRPR